KQKHKKNISNERYYDSTLLMLFIKHCIDKGEDIRNYSIYFDNKPGHIDRYDTLRRRIKFLLNQ
ncbi:TPA: capsular biosynthesis protein, partial [Escherichia coli]|nr:capsular biosynthesis protein [Escherichia coli]